MRGCTMGFDVNFNHNQPMIKESQKSQDGGAGNTGYFEVSEEEQKKRKQQAAGSIFNGYGEEQDSFHHEGEDEEKSGFSFSKLIAQIFFIIKSAFKKIFNLK